LHAESADEAARWREAHGKVDERYRREVWAWRRRLVEVKQGLRMGKARVTGGSA